MRERRFRVPLYFTAEEKADLHSKAEAACMNYNRFIRMLIAGYDPVVIPDDIFYESMEMIRQFADKIDEVAIKADNAADVVAIMAEARKWRSFQNEIEKELLRPKKRR